LGFVVNADVTRTGAAIPKTKEAVLAAARAGIGKPVFALSDPKNAAEFNAYREQYRSFRVGNARGAKGEVSQFTNPAASTTPHIVPPFLTKLYDMVTCNTYTDLIHWSTDGTAVVISNITMFSQSVLPQYFKHSKFASFLRQLNMYNFYTTRQEPQLREFKNPFFIREKVNLMSNIKRKRAQTKTTKEGAAASSAKRQRTTKSSVSRGAARPRGKRAAKSRSGGGAGNGNGMDPSNSGNGGGDGSSINVGSSGGLSGGAAGSLTDGYSPAARAFRKQLVLATAQANAARAESASLQRSVDASQRECVTLRRKMDQMQSCLEQVCNTLGNDTWQIYQSSFGVRQSSGSISSFNSGSPDLGAARSRNDSADVFELNDSFFEESMNGASSI
jgi:hypothetical protein